jgi:hypothetical protein
VLTRLPRLDPDRETAVILGMIAMADEVDPARAAD